MIQEKIARILHEIDPITGHSSVWSRLSSDDKHWYMTKASFIVPVVLEEKMKAWVEGQSAGMDDGLTVGEIILGLKPGPLPGPARNPYYPGKD